MQAKMWLATAMLACCSGVGVAQMAMSGGAEMPMGSMTDPAKAEDVMLTAFEGELTGVVKAMPADKFNFAPSATAFAPGQPTKFEGVRTFSQQVAHLIQANYYFYGQVSGTKPGLDMKAIGTLKTKDELVSALAASFVFAHQCVATITPANAFVTIEGADGMKTRATVASFAVAHGFDHYGQMIEYLRMNGVVPPGSK
ncbi:MAG: DinB family protein [Janthinobacterium lividum]